MSNHWLQSYSGRVVDLVDVDRNRYSTRDIAVQLSCQPRFNGATARFYSVLEHTLTGYHLYFDNGDEGLRSLALAWLLHDAAEAYLGDMPTPLKEMCPGYREVEERLARSIYEYFGADFSLWKSSLIKEIDLELLVLEKAAFMAPSPRSWGDWADWDDYDPKLAKELQYFPLAATDSAETYEECLTYEVNR